jgi:uncharacterized protein
VKSRSQHYPELAPFLASVRQTYGGRLHGLYLFGSRARGDNRSDSDYDIAVVLEDTDLPLWQEQDRLADMAYDLLLSRGIHIQPIPFTLQDWQHNEDHRDVIRLARKDALELALPQWG